MLMHTPAALSLHERLVFAGYQCAVRALQWVLPLKLAKRARLEPGYGVDVPARFGHYPSAHTMPDKAQQWVWVHAVSLGETRASVALVDELRQHYPQLRLLLTHGTATGLEAGRALLKEGDVQTWLPWDSASAVNGFLNHFRPRIGLVMETEVWPTLCVLCARHGLPLYVVNARMSQRSMDKALRLATLSRLAFRHLAGVVAQTAQDAQRFKALGATVVGTVGNLKFDMPVNAQQVDTGQALAKRLSQPVVMLASSREGEEVMWLKAIDQLNPAQRNQVQWLLVPRHPQRVAEVYALLENAGWQVSLRSAWGEQLQHVANREASAAPTVWLGDSMGEMAFYFAMSRVALLGGSFEALGGQNLIEAAACGCVVVAGPHTFNFEQATEQAIEAGACLRVRDMTQGLTAALALVAPQAGKRPAYEARAQAALAWTHTHRGAARRTVDLLAPSL
ncbi:3-deoxy-D-manno-octulosonic acid transferase [Comamonadaceae bacterium M7527]|nr:3-deoxy-D-manno-octulosonic acid transferase [Comamonadaceae bacterium M7527]